jgi:hypothetical protein
MKKAALAPAPTAILTTSEVARWLRKSARTVERNFVSAMPGRYVAAHILERLAERRAEEAARRARRKVSAPAA